MNNKLVLNPRGRNHIKVMPLKHCMEVPADNKEKLDFCKTIYHDLETKADRKFLEKKQPQGLPDFSLGDGKLLFFNYINPR